MSVISKRFPILYKYSKNDSVLQWQVYTEDDKVFTISGVKGGKLITSSPTFCEVKNKGKKNEKSAQEQAIAEATSRFNHKIKTGYSEKKPTEKIKGPMLADSYFDKNGNVNKWVKSQIWESGRDIYVQPKLDGLRNFCYSDRVVSREGKEFVMCRHLHHGVKNTIIDGELYNHTFKDDFNVLLSSIKADIITEERLKRAKSIVQLWAYDMPSVSGSFSKRYETLKKFVLSNPELLYKLVPTFKISSEEELKKFHKRFKSEGFEGTIIRVDGNDYEHNRCRQLVKYKDFVDEEFKISGYIEGKGKRKGTIGKFILKHDKVEDQTFKCNVTGDFKYLSEIWKNRDSYIGKTATVKYFNRTPKTKTGGDVPRFGRIIKLAREDYE